MDNLDGNLYALRQYEDRQDRQDQAWECVLADIEPILNQIELLDDSLEDYSEVLEALKIECYNLAMESDYEWSEEIDSEIGERT